MKTRQFRSSAFDQLALPEPPEEVLQLLSWRSLIFTAFSSCLKWSRSTRVRTRTVLQMEATECGAAALAILFSYFRLFIPLERLREDCGISRDGTTAARLLAVARQYGFETLAFRKEPESLMYVSPPVIIHWNFDHFVVLEGLGKNKAWINDPARGRRTVSRAEFDRCFTGPVLILRPGANFRRHGSPPRVIPLLLKWASEFREHMTILGLLGGFLAITGVAIPALSRHFVDRVLVAGRTDLLRPVVVACAATALCRGLLTWFQRDALAKLANRLVRALSSQFIRKATQLPLSFYLARHPGDVAARAEIGDRISWLLSGDLPAAVLASVMAVFYAVLMFVLEPGLAAVACFIAAAHLLMDRMGASFRADNASQAAHEQVRWLGTTMSGLQMIETLKANGTESRFLEKWSSHLGRVSASQYSLAVFSECMSIGTRYWYSLGALAVLGLGALRVKNGEMTAGTLVAFQSLTASFVTPLAELTGFAARFDEIRAELARYQDVLDYGSGDATHSTAEGQGDSAALQGAVQFRNVTFGYNPLRPPCVAGLSFSAMPGSHIGVVGRTGSGKSTLARLVSGLLCPWTGEVFIDGKRRREITPDVLAAAVAVIEQEIFLFEGTIAENLTLGNSTISRDALNRAIQDACLNELIDRLPDGMNTRLAEGGRNLSGGERQRLEIARALARDPVVLVMDEATSALDPDTEHRIHERISLRHCTCIIIAHRLSTVRDCDEILVLESGQVIERGTHGDLWRKGGTYRELIATEGAAL